MKTKISNKNIIYIEIGLAIGIILYTILLIYIGYNIGYMQGTAIQEQVLLDQLAIRDLNVTNRLCIIPGENSLIEQNNMINQKEDKLAICKALKSTSPIIRNNGETLS